MLKEYGFADSETATYTRDDGRKLTIKAARFNDATGAYGAFTFYRQPAMQNRADRHQGRLGQRPHPFLPQQRPGGRQLRSHHRDVGRRVARTGRDVAGRYGLGRTICPRFRNILPKNDAVENSAKYILGPQALLAVKAPLTAEQVDFSHEPEILMQDYSSKDGPLTLTLISYPTPQIAGDRLRALQSCGSRQLRARCWSGAAGRWSMW